MSTLEIALAEITLLKARVAALEAGKGGSSASPGGAEALPDHLLDSAWANKVIAKDPKQWKGPSQIGRTYDRAPVEWLQMMAHNTEYKASCGRALPDSDPKKWRDKPNKKGERVAWHEGDTVEAKILRGWAARNALKPKPASKPVEADGDDDFNFGANDPGGF